VELNASWCYDWGQKLGDLIEQRYGIPYSRTGQPYGPDATREWLFGVAIPLGKEREALDVIERETREVEPDLAFLRQALSGRTAIIEISEFPGPIRALSLARMAEEFGAHPVVINVHPYTIKERMPSIRYMLETGINPEIILTRGLFKLGSFRSSKETEEELEAIVEKYDNPIFFGNSGRFPPCPLVNLSLLNPAFQPHYGYAGIKNIAALVRQALSTKDLPRSRLFRGMLYGTGTR
jgi:nitrogenase molybdenum-iron protein alpha/beta subunit